MKTLANGYRIFLLFVALLVFVTSCANNQQINSETASSTSEKKESSVVFPTTAEVSTNPVSSESVNRAEIIEEELSLVEQKKCELKELLISNKSMMEYVAGMMIDLQREELTTADSVKWKKPYYCTDKKYSRMDMGQVNEKLLADMEKSLDELSKNGAFNDVYPDCYKRILDSDVCHFHVELVNSIGDYFCSMSLCYSVDQSPIEHEFFYVDWLDEHWFVYEEWHE